MQQAIEIAYEDNKLVLLGYVAAAQAYTELACLP